MSSNPTVREMVRAALEAGGYDGLYSMDSECGCELADLFPCCGDGVEHCKAGHKVPCACGEGCDWHIGPRKAVEEEP